MYISQFYLNAEVFSLKHTIIGPWLGVGAFWKISSDSSSVVVSCCGAFPRIPPPPISAGSGGLGGAFASNKKHEFEEIISHNKHKFRLLL